MTYGLSLTTPSSRAVRQRGFTLIEVMLVLVILSVGAGAVVMALPQSDDDKLEQASRSLQLRLQLLSDEALLSGMTYGLHLDTDNATYQWGQLTSDGWQEIDHRQIPAKQEFDDLELNLILGAEDADERWFSDTLFEGDGSLFEQGSFDDESKPSFPDPQVWISSSGEVTEARIVFYPTRQSDQEGQNWRVVIRENGTIALLRPDQSFEAWQEEQEEDSNG
jgi:general secretion pathway protein H